ncbi:MAG TPA: YihY/virulence factor BrkB family protein [Candidatus Limnocylindrales bacterium]|nr:YihY/virulence factor BrkB family protein [Candidatus Limnocylindrales bacterium]
MDVRSIASRILALPLVRFVMAVLDTYGKAPGGILANGLAFAALFSALPTTLLILGIAGLVASGTEFQAQLAAALGQAFPPLADLFDDALAAVSQGAGVASILGLVGLLWGVSQFYATLDLAFSRIFSDAPERDFARRTLRGFAWVLLLIGAVLVVLILAGLSSLIDTVLPDSLDSMRPIRTLLTSPLTILAFGVVAVAIAYRVLPPKAPRWRSILPPAILVGIAITVLTQIFTFLVPFLVGAAAIAGSLASAFIALAWLSFSFQALLYGASWVRVAELRAAAEASTARD